MADTIQKCQEARTDVTAGWMKARDEALKCKATIDNNPVAAKAIGAPAEYAGITKNFSDEWAMWAQAYDCAGEVNAATASPYWSSLAQSAEGYRKAFIALNDAVWAEAKKKKKKRAADKKAAAPAEKPAVEAAQQQEDAAAKKENDAQVPATKAPDGTDLSKGVGKGEGSDSTSWMLWGGIGLVGIGLVLFLARSRSQSVNGLSRRRR